MPKGLQATFLVEKQGLTAIEADPDESSTNKPSFQGGLPLRTQRLALLWEELRKAQRPASRTEAIELIQHCLADIETRYCPSTQEPMQFPPRKGGGILHCKGQADTLAYSTNRHLVLLPDNGGITVWAVNPLWLDEQIIKQARIRIQELPTLATCCVRV